MLKVLRYKNKKTLETFLNKRKSAQKDQSLIVNKIIKTVRKNGDEAVLKYEKKFSNVKTKSKRIIFSNKEINDIAKKTDKKIKRAINLSFNRIKKFHLKQKTISFKF